MIPRSTKKVLHRTRIGVSSSLRHHFVLLLLISSFFFVFTYKYGHYEIKSHSDNKVRTSNAELNQNLSRNASNVSSEINLRNTEPLSLEVFGNITRQLANSDYPPGRLLDPSIISSGKQIWVRNQRDAGVPSDEWDLIADDVAFAIKTGSEVAQERIAELRDYGWLSVGRRVPNLLIVSDAPIPSLGVIDIKRYAADLVVGSLRTGATSTNGSPAFLPKGEWFGKAGWSGDKDKNLPAFHLLRSTFPNAKWYILLDDDTYIFLDNFAHYIAPRSHTIEPMYTGKSYYIANCAEYSPAGYSATNERRLFAHGGAGILLNHRAMNELYPKIEDCIRSYSDCYAGDMQVGLCMKEIGIKLHDFPNGQYDEFMFTPYAPSRAMADSRYAERLQSKLKPVTFHKIPRKEHQLMANFDRFNALNKSHVDFNSLRIYLQSYGIQPIFGWRPTKYDTDVFQRREQNT